MFNTIALRQRPLDPHVVHLHHAQAGSWDSRRSCSASSAGEQLNPLVRVIAFDPAGAVASCEGRTHPVIGFAPELSVFVCVIANGCWNAMLCANREYCARVVVDPVARPHHGLLGELELRRPRNRDSRRVQRLVRLHQRAALVHRGARRGDRARRRRRRRTLSKSASPRHFRSGPDSPAGRTSPSRARSTPSATRNSR